MYPRDTKSATPALPYCSGSIFPRSISGDFAKPHSLAVVDDFESHVTVPNESGS